MKKVLILLILGLGSFAGISQNFKARILTNPTKYGFGQESYQLSFTVNADSRNDLVAGNFESKVLADPKIKSCQVIIDDTRPIAVLIIKADIKSENEFLTLIKNLFTNLGLVDLNLNERHFSESQTIQL